VIDTTSFYLGLGIGVVVAGVAYNVMWVIFR